MPTITDTFINSRVGFAGVVAETHAAPGWGAAGGRVVDAVDARAMRSTAGELATQLITRAAHHEITRTKLWGTSSDPHPSPLQERLELERQEHIHHLLAVTLLLYVGELAAAAVRNASLRDFV